MKKITDSYVEEHIKHAVEQLVPDRAEELWKQPVEQASGDEWYLDGIRGSQRNKGTIIKIFSSAAACFAVCFLSYYMIHLRTDATIYIDVNPSIEIQINRRERVLLAEANNQDGEIVLEDMDLKDTGLNVAMNAILGSMVKHGYLSEAQNMVLLSVDCGNEKKADTLRERLSVEVDSCLENLIGSGLILDQDVSVDESLETLAVQYKMTPGKAALLKKLVEYDTKLNYSELAELTVDELTVWLMKEGIDLCDFVNCTGDDLEEAFPSSNPDQISVDFEGSKKESKEIEDDQDDLADEESEETEDDQNDPAEEESEETEDDRDDPAEEESEETEDDQNDPADEESEETECDQDDFVEEESEETEDDQDDPVEEESAESEESEDIQEETEDQSDGEDDSSDSEDDEDGDPDEGGSEDEEE